MKKKIGLALITCNREKFFVNAAKSLPYPDELIIINDGKPFIHNYENNCEYVQHRKNMGVGFSKNEGIKYLLTNECDYIFLMEDDIIIKDENIYDKYIKASEVSGLKHLNFAYHGPFNKDALGKPKPRKTVSYDSNVKINLHSHLAGAFSFYTRDLLMQIGLMDPYYINAFEHLDHTLSIISKGYNPPFRWFPDISESFNLIEDQDPNLQDSIIRKNRILFELRIRYYKFHFRNKWGYAVEDIPDSDEQSVNEALKRIKEQYTQK